MKQLPPLPEPAVVRRSAHGYHGTFTAAQMTAYGGLCIAPAKRTPGTVPMHSHETKTGEGDMPVTCRFDFDSDGDIDVMQVWCGAANIFRALTLAQIEELDAECHASAAVDFAESKADAAIARFEADRDEVTL